MSSRKSKANAPRQEPMQVAKLSVAETDEQAMARATLSPPVNHALTVAKVLHRDYGDSRLTELCKELAAQCNAVSDGTMERPEALLTAQAHTLDAIFNDLTRVAYRNWENFAAAERLLRMAFKAQSQSRATVETLGNLRNPRTFIAQQANIAHGPQQVNNGDPSRTREGQSEQSKLLEQTHGERLDTGAAGQAIGGDPAMATVGAVHRPEDKGR